MLTGSIHNASHVDSTLRGNNETAKGDMKFDLLKARLSGPGGNTTGANNLTTATANAAGNVDVASILMDPLDFYQASRRSDCCVPSLQHF